MLKIYNSLSRQKETFIPREPGKVGMYVCGITVYGYCHIGHARMMVAFDVVARYLRQQGYALKHVRNITDIDDKIIRYAEQAGEPFEAVTERFIKAMHEDFALLGTLPPDEEPRATGYIQPIIDLIQTLQNKDFAYQGANGDVYYRVRKFDGYGKLSGETLEGLLSGARVNAEEAKDDPLDFVLWKAAKPGEPKWPSPWGDGRPGWHIECSAMASKCLGDHFDIHGGGLDLRFPHHENEIAQSEAATGKTFVNVWMHNGFVQMDEEKMSKSLGNFFTVRDVLAMDKNPARMGEVLRYMMIASHYRSSLNYTGQSIANARSALTRFYLTLSRLDELDVATADAVVDKNYVARFNEAMDDDFNTPEALAVMFELVRECNRKLDTGELASLPQSAATLKYLGDTLGLFTLTSEDFLETGGTSSDGSIDIQQLIDARNTARAEKNFARADELRDRLNKLGVIMEDRPDGITSWRIG